MIFDFLVYNKFKSKKWEKLSPDDRLKLFQKLENIQSRRLKRPACKIIPEEMEEHTRGLFLSNEFSIHLNIEYFLDSILVFDGMVTLFHEGRHAFQYYVCFVNKNRLSNLKNKWLKSFQGYDDGKTDKFSFYTMQPIERDASKYALNRLKSLYHYYKNSDTYLATIRFRENEFADNKIQAKKELGIFYRLKLAWHSWKKRTKNNRGK